MRTWDDIFYFKPSEFDSADAPGSGRINMDPEFVFLLDEIRHHLGKPMHVNSGYRTPTHNVKVGGATNSAHKKQPCRAADVACPTWEYCFEVVRRALQLGIRRIGIQAQGKFVHLDTDPTLPSPRIWFYP